MLILKCCVNEKILSDSIRLNMTSGLHLERGIAGFPRFGNVCPPFPCPARQHWRSGHGKGGSFWYCCILALHWPPFLNGGRQFGPHIVNPRCRPGHFWIHILHYYITFLGNNCHLMHCSVKRPPVGRRSWWQHPGVTSGEHRVPSISGGAGSIADITNTIQSSHTAATYTSTQTTR